MQSGYIGYIVIVLVIAILVGGFAFFQPGRRKRGGQPERDTLNPRAEQDGPEAAAPPHQGRLIGNPPTDTMSADGTGTAIAGGGAGGTTPDARRPITGSGSDTENSPDAS